eukprot:m51a1_g4939 putative carbonic anhydrase (216) ;mRNA; r:301285-302255
MAEAESSLQKLLAGNRRFVEGNPAHKDLIARRKDTATNGQHPFATVVTCSDSRCCPEFVFDTSLGDIFVVRTAGSAMGPFDLGSVEYAAGHLNTPLIAVVGHTKCGAVTACCAALTAQKLMAPQGEHQGASGHGGSSSGVPHGALGDVVSHLMGQVRDKHEGGLDAMIAHNARRQAEDLLAKSEELRHLSAEGKVRVAYLVQDVLTGEVKHLGWV